MSEFELWWSEVGDVYDGGGYEYAKLAWEKQSQTIKSMQAEIDGLEVHLLDARKKAMVCASVSQAKKMSGSWGIPIEESYPLIDIPPNNSKEVR